MKPFAQIFMLLTVFILLFPTGRALAQDDGDNGGDPNVSFQTFYDQLGDQGNWVQTNDYGYVWQPGQVSGDWRPYTNGHWVYTDAGWTWVSDEPWGWATYHYGRWVNLDDEGWCWVPGYTWAPAWVSWRYGGGYAGWAPLPPETSLGIDFGGDGIDIGIGFHIGDDCDRAYGIGAGWYNFCPQDRLGERNYRRYMVDRNRNYDIINRTRNITNINVNRNAYNRGGFRGVHADGPSFDEINAHSRTPLQRAQLSAMNRPGNGRLQGNSLGVYAPRVNSNGSQGFRPKSVNRTLSNANVNRGTDPGRPMWTHAGSHPAAASSEQVQAARHAQSSAPSGAGIATVKTQPSRRFSQPLTTLHPVGNSSNNRARTENHPGNLGREAQVNKPAQNAVAPHVTQHANQPVPKTGEDRAFTGGTGNNSHSAAPAQEHHASAPIQHRDATPAEHHVSAPMHHTESQAVSHPVSHPQASHPPSHPQGGVNHSSGGGHPGGGGHPSHSAPPANGGKDNGKNDKH